MQHDLIDIFNSIFDIRKGKISEKTFIYYMTSMGEKFQKEEVLEMLKEVNAKDGYFDIDHFIRLAMRGELNCFSEGQLTGC